MAEQKWGNALLPLIVVFILVSLVFGLVGFLVGNFQGNAGEILFWTWPPFFMVSALCCTVAALAMRTKNTQLFGVDLSKGEATALVLALIFGVGFIIALLVALYIRINNVPNESTSSIAWTVAGCGIGIFMGSISGPTFLNWMFHRMGLGRGFIWVADLLLFACGILLAVIFYRHGLLKDRPVLLIMVTGALIASPIGMVVSNKLLARERA